MISTSEKIRFIQSVFGLGKMGRVDINVRCPVCMPQDQAKKKLSIRLTDDLCHCWVCGWSSRSMLSLIFKYGTREQLSEYKEHFLPELNLPPRRCGGVIVVEEEEERLAKLPDDFRLLVECDGSRDPDARALLTYVRGRGLTDRELWYWHLGMSDEYSYHRRVIMPSFDVMGSLNYYVGRIIDDVPTWKYLNCRVDKLTVIFNEMNIDWQKPLTLVEGPFDLMKCRGNATCLLGSDLSEKSMLFDRILEHQTPVILMLDSDMKQKVQRIAKRLVKYDLQVSVVDLETFHDPGQMTFDEVEKCVGKAKEWDWMMYFSSRLKNVDTSSSLGRF